MVVVRQCASECMRAAEGRERCSRVLRKPRGTVCVVRKLETFAFLLPCICPLQSV